MENTDFGKVTPEMLRDMVSDTKSTEKIPDQYVAIEDIEMPDGKGDNHGDR